MKLAIAIMGLLLAAAAPALADDGGGDILQIKQAFDPETAQEAVGAVVNFVNDDDVNHNLVVIAPDGVQTDYGVEKPGDTTRISFPTAGVYSVICHIHPRMKMKVTVG
jgi:plastocyanin